MASLGGLTSNTSGGIMWGNTSGISSATTTSGSNLFTSQSSTAATSLGTSQQSHGNVTNSQFVQLAQQNAALQQQVLQQQVTFEQPSKFNKFVNASDLLKDFIKFLGEIGVNQKQFLDLPIEIFINWLVIMAAKADGEAPPEDVRVKDHPRLPAPYYGTKCRACGRFVGEAKAREGLPFCGPDHVLIFMHRKGITDGR